MVCTFLAREAWGEWLNLIKNKKNSPWHSGFFLILFVAICSASLLAFFAGEKSVSDAWTYLPRDQSEEEIPSGFVVVDMSDVFLSSRGDGYDPNELSGIGPIPEEPSYQEGEVVFAEVMAEDKSYAGTLTRQKMDIGNLKGNLKVAKKGVSTSGLDNKTNRVEQAPGKTDALKAVTLEEVSSVWVEHSVKPGETLFDIAKNSGLIADDIIKANGISNPNRLALGQLLLIPRSRKDVGVTLAEVKRRRVSLKVKKKRAVPLKVTIYKVKNGDSLWSIASKSKVTIDTLFGSNRMKDPDRLKPGAKLRVPNQNGIFYTVKKGDTLAGIARKNDVDLKKVASINGLNKNSVLSIKQELFLPGTSQAASSYKRGVSHSSKTLKSTRASKGMFRWPVVGRINSPFGWRRHPVLKRRSFHTGVDIKARRYTKIRAARSGRVSYSGWMGGYGRVVVIKHNSTYSTLYAHAQKLYVRKGQKVSAGQVIALVGSSGRTTGPHLHFEIRKRNKPVNPLRYLR